MPMGATHRRINTAVSIPLAATTLVMGWQPLHTGVLLIGYTFATFFMNPDLDINSVGYQSWGWLRFIWWPYQKVLGHRCWVSHFPVVSTILRIIYLLWFPILLLFLLSATARAAVVHNDLPAWLLTVAPFLLIFTMGMILSDSLHAILDVGSTDLKRFLHGTWHGHSHENFFSHHNQPLPRRLQAHEHGYSRNRGRRAPSRRRRY